MGKISNKELMDKVIGDLPPHEQTMLQGVETGADFLTITDTYPNIMNSFINTLTNKVAKFLIYSEIYENPLKELKKGFVEYGDSIEELFVQMAVAKNFGEHWGDGSTTPEADLIRKIKPKVTALYISVNFDKKYKTTVMDKQLRKAFLNEGGLSNLVMMIVGSLTSQAEYQEFMYTKKILKSLVEKAQNWKLDADHGVESAEDLKGKIVKQTLYVVDTKDDTKALLKEVRTAVGQMGFPSTKFNVAKELNWCRPEDLILITTPDVAADIDVNVLAGAFNVSMAEIQTRTILVDEMPTGIFQKAGSALVDKTPYDIGTGDTIQTDSSKIPKAILCDRETFQIWDTYQGMETFRNGEGLYTNYFANREGIFAFCAFANMAVFY